MVRRLRRRGPGQYPAPKWQKRFLELAKHFAEWSKDTTRVGAVAWDPKTLVPIQPGYNGLPRGVRDLPDRMERPAKYLWTAHAEENIVANAARQVLEGSTVSVTHFCCCACARMLINAGVRQIEYGSGVTSMPKEQFEIAEQMFLEAGVTLVKVE